MNEQKMERLLQMAEHPERFDEKEIELLMSDGECREYYELMVMSEEGFRRRKYDKESDAPASDSRTDMSSCGNKAGVMRKAVAVAAIVVMLAGIAFAAIHVTVGGRQEPEETCQTERITAPEAGNQAETKRREVQATVGNNESVVFENVELERILSEMSEFYSVGVEFRNDDARRLRLFFKWDKGSSAEQVVEDLSHFERVRISMANNSFVVE